MMMRSPGQVHGFSLLEFLVALVVFSIAVSGAMTAQLDAMSLTRETLTRMAALRTLRDLANRDGVSALAPRAMSLDADAGAPDLPPLLAAWVTETSRVFRPPAGARLCVARDAAPVTLALAWDAADASGGCEGPTKRVQLLVASP